MNSLYWLGWMANGLFSWRFLDQWLQSERSGQSIVPRRFWLLSLIGNGLMALHGALQLQYPIMLVQLINGFIAWRNLRSAMPAWGRHLCQLSILLLMGSAAYATLSELTQGQIVWARSPLLWGSPVHPLWHLLGALAIGLFASRFWIQWWHAERGQRQAMPSLFWWMSLVGAFAAVLYFGRIGDPVNVVGYGLGIIPYWRNLLLMRSR
jgi:lipid-A-disaccharide synthase-like uncharacterized protein